MHIALIVKPGHPDSGVGRYAQELEKALLAAGCQVTRVHPRLPFPAWLARLVQRLLGWDLQAFFATYPLWARYPPADLYHFTSQNLATLLVLHPPPGPAVVTVHDIIPHLLRRQGLAQDQGLWMRTFDRIANRGLSKACFLICDSTFTQMSLLKEFQILVGRSQVVYLGIHGFLP